MHPDYMPALITPFSEDGEIDRDAVRHNVGTLSARGLLGFLLAGSNGEGPYLEPGERRDLCASARTAAPEAFFLCGITAESVRIALAQIDEAVAGGADAVLVTTPTSLVRGRHALVAGFYEAVAEHAGLPVFLYSVPRVTGYDLPTETAVSVAGHQNVIGIKDSGGHPGKIAALADADIPGFTVYAGASGVLALSVAAGAHGGITASANYVPDLVEAVVTAARESLAAAAGAQRRLTAVAGAVEAHGVAGVKAAAAVTGLRAGVPRPPLRPLSGADLEAVRAAVAAADSARVPD